MGGPDSKPAVACTFPKSRRLQRSGDFARLKAEGERQVCGSLVFNWKVHGPTATIASAKPPAWPRARPAGNRLGVVTSRRIGNAVARNRARRLLREAFRLHQTEIQRPADLVLVARPSIARRNFAAVERDFLQCLHRSGLTRLPLPSNPAPPACSPANVTPSPTA